MISMPNFPRIGRLQLFKFTYTLSAGRLIEFVLSAGVFTVQESFCLLTDQVRTLFFM